MKKRWLVVFGLGAFVLTLLLHAPAALTYAWTLGAREGGPFAFHGVHGTLSQGGFAALTVNRRPVLQDVTWTLRPAWLALLRVTADLRTGGDAVARVRVSRSVFGAVRLSSLTSAGSVKGLLQLAGQPPLPIEGQARLDFPLVRIDGTLPVEAQGSLEVENLAWMSAREPLALGSFNAAVTTDAQGIVASFGSGPGPLEVGGSGVLKPDRSYELDVQLRPRAGAPDPLVALLRALGAPDAQGWYHLRRRGTLP
jgi:general secretion pathway protein N